MTVPRAKSGDQTKLFGFKQPTASDLKFFYELNSQRPSIKFRLGADANVSSLVLPTSIIDQTVENHTIDIDRKELSPNLVVNRCKTLGLDITLLQAVEFANAARNSESSGPHAANTRNCSIKISFCFRYPQAEIDIWCIVLEGNRADSVI